MTGYPSLAAAVVSDKKLVGYLLNPHHKVGAPKLALLESFGFVRSDPDAVRAALIRQAQSYAAIVTATPFGVKFEVDGLLETPSGQSPFVRTVWHLDAGENVAHLVTFKPLRRR